VEKNTRLDSGHVRMPPVGKKSSPYLYPSGRVPDGYRVPVPELPSLSGMRRARAQCEALISGPGRTQNSNLNWNFCRGLDSIQTSASNPEKIPGNFMEKDFDVMNNFCFRNFLRFETEFELKFRESKWLLKSFGIYLKN
jgi:hypothetical protein